MYLIFLGLLIILIIIFFLAKKLLKIFIIFLFIFLLSGGVLGYLAYKDGKEILTSFETGDIIVLLINQQTVITGFSSDMSYLNGTFAKEDFTNLTIFSSPLLRSYSLLLAQKDYSSLLTSHDLLILIDLETYSSLLNDEIIIEDEVILNKEELLTLLNSENLLNSYIYQTNSIFNHTERLLIQSYILPSYSIDTSEEFKTYLLLASLADSYYNDAFLTKLFTFYKQDKLIIYPDGFVLPLLIRFLPPTFLDKV